MGVEPFAEAQGENSRLTIPLTISYVNYQFSTSIWRMDTFVRITAQREENKGVELTGGGDPEEGEVNSRQFKVEDKDYKKPSSYELADQGRWRAWLDSYRKCRRSWRGERGQKPRAGRPRNVCREAGSVFERYAGRARM